MKINVNAPSREPTPKEAQDAFLEQKKAELKSGEYRQWQSLVQRPPLPFLRTRRGAVPPPACASAYTVEPVCLWDPSTYFPEIEVRCWHCRSKNVKVKGWTDGKTIDGINGTYRFYAKRMKCMNPSCKMPFSER